MSETIEETTVSDTARQRLERARAIVDAGGIDAALESGALPRRVDVTLSEALVLGLVRQGVRTFISVFGHGSTDVGEVLRVYEDAGLVRTFGVRNEIEASHAAMALRWVTDEKAAVVTSIGPSALQAMAGSIAPACDGVGVWYLFGDETTQDEGPNMQQIPKHERHLYLKLCETMGKAYCLHTPESVSTALRRGLNTVDHPHRAGPFYLLTPMNTQPAMLHGFNMKELPVGAPPPLGAAADDGAYARAADALLAAERVVVKVGGGARSAGEELSEVLDLADAVAVTSPLVSGMIPHDHPRNMTVGGSKGSLSGNYAMDEADLLLAIGTRFVCQSDCSRTGYPPVARSERNGNDSSKSVTRRHACSTRYGAKTCWLSRSRSKQPRIGRGPTTPSRSSTPATRKRTVFKSSKTIVSAGRSLKREPATWASPSRRCWRPV